MCLVEKPPNPVGLLGRKTERCARLPSLGGYAEEELRDPCIGEKPPNPVGNGGGKPRDQ